MTDLIPFVSKAGLAASSNMEDFIRFCRDKLTVFGRDLDFDASAWDVTAFYQLRGKTHKRLINFTGISPRKGCIGPPMPEPFASQTKSCIRYLAGRESRKSPPFGHIAAFRALLAAFISKSINPDLVLVDANLLDHAVVLAAEGNSDNGAKVGVNLGILSRLLREKNLAAYAPIDWQHGQEWQGRKRSTIDKRRAAAMPSNEALLALPLAFRRAREPRDVILTAVMALLACAPSRINEVFGLPFDCEIKPLTEGDDGFMLRWAGSKGHCDFAKAIPAIMADVAKEAIERLRENTAEARRIAAWYEENPDRLYLPDDCSHLRGKDLTGSDINLITGFINRDSGRSWAIDRKIVPIQHLCSSNMQKDVKFLYSDIERAILSLLPHGFPVLDKTTGLRYSEALLVVRRLEFAARGRGRWRCMISPVMYGNIMDNFHNADGVFGRLGLSTPEHPIVLRTHQLRHYLNTMAQRGGLTETEIAAWSGRKDVRQNAAYDHRTPEEMLQLRRQRDKELTTISGSVIKVNPPVAQGEAVAHTTHGHSTEIGFCEHDFAASPCAMFMECLHCTKHVCVKGHDPRHLDRVMLSLKRAYLSFDKAEAAFSRDYEGSENWVIAHRETIERLEQLQAILTDPAVPDGSLIRLAKSGRYSLVEQAMRDQGYDTGALPSQNATGLQTLAGRNSDV